MYPARLILVAILFSLLGTSALGLISEGRPGIPYFNRILFLDRKVMEGNEVRWVSLAYAAPEEGDLRCSNTVDVLNGRELFQDVPEQSWVLIDYELQSILVEGGFYGDADVFAVRACADRESCLELQKRLEADPDEVERRRQARRPEKVETVSLEKIGKDLEIGRRLVQTARCRGCHRIEGFGAEHAPSLTWRRFKYEAGWLAGYLDAPYRMRPGMKDLMMLRFTSPNAQPNLQLPEVKAVSDYLTKAAWTKAPADRFRAEPWKSYRCYDCHRKLYREKPLEFVPTPVPEGLRRELRKIQVFKRCVSCHPFGDMSSGNTAGALAMTPDLLLATEKLEINYLVNFVRDPEYLQPGAIMPKLDLTAGEIEDVRRLAILIREAIAREELRPVHVFYRMEKRSDDDSMGNAPAGK